MGKGKARSMDDSEKISQARKTIEEWIDKQSHDRCWYYPDLFNKLAELFEIKPTKSPSLPPLEEFKVGCEKYQEEEYKKKK